jgi:hypothetical protein
MLTAVLGMKVEGRYWNFELALLLSTPDHEVGAGAQNSAASAKIFCQRSAGKGRQQDTV